MYFDRIIIKTNILFEKGMVMEKLYNWPHDYGRELNVKLQRPDKDRNEWVWKNNRWEKEMPQTLKVKMKKF